ncbi:MAG: Rrf2 family transcriptional regulator [Candidatus Omnitrophica bacterium]|nr:Rrf2 family transcriptional regulator [Candidatus Omnitrophota bacterium]
MRITYKGDYALKTILKLSINYGKVLSIHKLAKDLDIPVKFLEQILLELKRVGFVKSRRGKVGGYFLARHPSKIMLGEIIRFVDGPIEPIACINDNYRGCNDMYRCIFRDLWKKITEQTSKIVDNISFEDLRRRFTDKKFLAYTI